VSRQLRCLFRSAKRQIQRPTVSGNLTLNPCFQGPRNPGFLD
jgi:hypothetical protein